MFFKKIVLYTVILSMLVSLLGISCAVSAQESAAVRIYVSPLGNDSGNGTKEAPYKTLSKARAHIASLNKATLSEGNIEVIIQEGTYSLGETFKLTKENSGTKKNPIVYKGEDGKKVKFTHAKRIDNSHFHKVSDEQVLSRLPEEAKGNVYFCDLKKLGITDLGTVERKRYGKAVEKSFEIYFNGTPLTIARYPNSKFSLTGQITKTGANGIGFIVEDERYKNWTKATEMMVYGFWNVGYCDDGLTVKELNEQTGEITTVESPYYDPKSDRKFYVYNLLEEVDIPGEYYLDRTNQTLYLYPLENISDAEIEYCTVQDVIFEISNAEYITFENILFEGACGNAITFSYCKNCNVKYCRIMNIAGSGITFIGGSDSTVDGCEIYNIGGGGVFSYCGNRNSLTPGNIVVTNNHIHKFAQYSKTYTPAIELNFVGNIISHNVIHDAPHLALKYGGNNNIIEYNEIYDVLKETDDAGAIYGGRDFTTRGNIIRKNYIHDIIGPGSQAVGIYLDDMISGITVSDNILKNVTQPLGIGGGHDNIIKNNLLLDKTPNTTNSLYYDDRGLQAWFGGSYTADPQNHTLYKTLVAMPYQSEKWKESYPELYNILDGNPMIPQRGVITGNIISNHGKTAIADAVIENGTVENNYVTSEKIGIISDERGKISFEDVSVFEEFPEYKVWNIENVGLNDTYIYDIPEPFVDTQSEKLQNIHIDVDMIDMTPIITEAENWDQSIFAPEIKGTELILKNGTTGYRKEKYDDGLFRFKYAMNESMTWVGFMLRSTLTNKEPWVDGGCYLIVMKKNQFELQRWGSGGSKMIRTVENTNYAGDNEFANVDIQLATIDDVGVSVIFRYNGQEIFNYIDTDDYAITKDGYFTVFHAGSDDSAVGKIGFYDPNLQTASVANPYGAGAEVIAETKCKLKINGKFVKFTTSPMLIDSVVYIPVLDFYDALGYEVYESKYSNHLIAFTDDEKIAVKKSENSILVNNNIIAVSGGVKEIDGKVAIPARFIGETLLGKEVSWDATTMTVSYKDIEEK